ncbi:MAG: CRISPR-associated protein Csx15 [Anaerolineae bacterium]|nr:CRISPR-associated protein Csx15 [Anaerolineae bacterium]MDW8300557.1 CRISPR-associated protein Csx15 [Anaerolineae bacterium]
MQIINFSHPLTAEQIEQIEARLGGKISEVRNVRVQFDVEQPFVPQVVELLDSLGVSQEQWQTEGWLIVLPSLNFITAVLLAELHGRTGHFPTVIRLKPVQDALVTKFELAEIINLEQVRNAARARR